MLLCLCLAKYSHKPACVGCLWFVSGLQILYVTPGVINRQGSFGLFHVQDKTSKFTIRETNDQHKLEEYKRRPMKVLSAINMHEGMTELRGFFHPITRLPESE